MLYQVKIFDQISIQYNSKKAESGKLKLWESPFIKRPAERQAMEAGKKRKLNKRKAGDLS